jgi:nucleotide-binding universal stress UspA family protein
MFKRLFVAVDDAQCSEDAVHLALELAQSWQASVTIAHVLAEPHLGMGNDELVNQAQQGQSLLAPWQELLQVADIAGSARLVYGANVAQTIVMEAETSGADLIVMGTHGRQGLERWLEGSVAEAVVRLAHLPILITHSGAVIGLPQRVLVALDGSATGEQALVLAEQLAPLAKASALSIEARRFKLFLTHVVPDETDDGDERNNAPDQVNAEGDTEGDWYLGQHILARAQSLTHLPTSSHLLAQGGRRIAEVLLAEAEARNADLIVMGTHGRRGLARWLFGSVAHEVIAGASIPVLLTRGLMVRGALEEKPRELKISPQVVPG